jgi:hypothetical protein
MTLFAVIRRHGPAWQPGRPLEEQDDWVGHAAFMDALTAEGFVLLGGPLEGASGALLIVRARSHQEIVERLAADPWTVRDLLRTDLLAPWTLRLGSLP